LLLQSLLDKHQSLLFISGLVRVVNPQENQNERLNRHKDEPALEIGCLDHCEVDEIQELEEVECQGHQWENLLFNDDTSALEFSVVHEGQVVLVDVVTEEEKEHQKDADRRGHT
jgi:hypothetical protein